MVDTGGKGSREDAQKERKCWVAKDGGVRELGS